MQIKIHNIRSAEVKLNVVDGLFIVRIVMSHKLLREYIRTVILEDDSYGGFDISGNAADSPYGASFGSGKDLYNVFVKPFTDVVSTTVGKTKELSQKAQTLAKVSFETLATTLIPVLADDYDEIFSNERAQLDKLKAQYKDIYDSTWTAFKDNDVVAAAFLYNPAAVITAKVAQQAPIQTVKLLNTLAGGKLDGFLKKVVDKFKLGDTKKPLDRDSGEGLPEGRIVELHRKAQSFGDILAQRGVKSAIAKNPKVSQMADTAQGIVDGSLQKVLKSAQAVASAKSVQDLQQKVGHKLKGADELAKLPAAERQQLEQVLLKSVKQSALSMYAKGIEDQIKQALKGGIPEDHPFIIAHKEVLSKLKSV